ncbi:recombinase family protein [Roseobacter sp. EG26]|uniref:recombinase family protein n=1 Tax=Roseobacter sp. EG26 TaxID=3412477 RepID=UPI003CE4A660
MTRTAIYARYSSDMQSEASIEDQVRLCELRAKADGHTITQTYADHGISGASTLLRTGVQTLMQDAIMGKFDTVFAEALDRLSRDQEDIAAIYKRLSFAGVRIVTLAEGEISELHIGLKGTMNALFLKDLAQKTRRGLRGRIEAGRSGGGNAFGYDVVKNEDDKGQRVINGTEAAVIQRIFNDYLAGISPKKIAFALNEEGIAAPTARHWGPSTIYGNRERGTGILNNELYIGRMVWNRLRYAKNPETGKRVSRVNPDSEWITKDMPDLRIIDQATWDAVKQKQGAVNKKAQSGFWNARRPKNLFSFLIKCGECGGGCSSVNATQIGCSSARNKGTCNNKLTISRNYLEEDILGALQDQLMDPELCALFCKEYTEHLNKLRRTRIDASTAQRKELAKLERERVRIVEAIKDGLPADMVRDDAQRISTRIDILKRELESECAPEPILHPAMSDMYAREVQKLIKTLNEPGHREEAAGLIRGLIDRIVLTPDPSKTRLVVNLEGHLAGILAMSEKRHATDVPLSIDVSDIKLLALASHRLNELAAHEVVGKAGCGSRI